VENIRKILFQTREKRIHPHKDDKILTDWNGLMIGALAKAGTILNNDDFLHMAEKAAGFIREHLKEDNGRLLHRYREGESAILGNLDDFAFMIWGLIELYQATFDPDHLAWALELTDQLMEEFWDGQKGGFYFTSHGGEKLLLRKKPTYDGAIPSGNSVMLMNLVKLGRITGRVDLEEKGMELWNGIGGAVMVGPGNHALFLCGLDFTLGPGKEVVISGDLATESTRIMLRKLRSNYLPNLVAILNPSGPSMEKTHKLIPYLENYPSLNENATAYVCENYACMVPTQDVMELLKQLEGRGRL